MRGMLLRRYGTAAVGALLVFIGAGSANADVQTSLSFLSPHVIDAGGSVSVDFGVTFIPLPASFNPPEFIDDSNSMQVSSCGVVAGACTELLIETTASVPSPLFAEVVAGNSFGPPNFYPETSAGSFELTLPYPNVGTWEITTAGGDMETIVEEECLTSFVGGEQQGGTSCSAIQTIPITGTFDPGGTPTLYVTVLPAGTPIPEPAGWAVLGLGVFGVSAASRRRRALANLVLDSVG